jgi:hypothetical protein
MLRLDAGHLKVFEIDGLGGVGKSRLLKELRNQAVIGERPGPVCWVSLEAEAFATETGPLMTIRDQIRFDCLLFDAAVVAYWHAIGQPFHLLKSSRFSNSLVVKTLDTGGSAAGIPVSLTFAAELFQAIKEKTTKLRQYKKAEFEGIDALRLDPVAIRLRLPHYLGLDIRRRLDSSKRSFVAFYDGYDRQAHTTLAARAPWLREFIGTLGSGVHIIATREPMRWPTEDWVDIVQPVFLDRLPEEESRQMLRARLGELTQDIENRLIEASRRLPFFLEAAIDAYELRARTGPPASVDELPTSPDTAITHLLDHLEPDHRTLAIALAAIQNFDHGLFSHIVRTLNLPISTVEFGEFLEWFFVERESDGLYKIHDLLTAFVYASAGDANVRRAALEASTKYLRVACEVGPESSLPSLMPMFRSTIAGWRATSDIPRAIVEELVDIGYLLYDAGYWHELVAIRHDGSATDNAIEVVIDFFSALSARRIEGVDRALDLFQKLESRLNLLGRHRRSAELELAYLSEISGNYARARQEFQVLDTRNARFDPSDRIALRARLYHADMLVMDGNFVEGARTLLEAYEVVGSRVPFDWAELVRHRAHAFRFSFALQQAEDLYSQAIAVAVDSPSLLGKLQTNLAETLCWYAPARALQAADFAREINLRLGNRIEMSKVDAARSVALATLGEFVAAREAAHNSMLEARDAGYPAGVAFGLQAAAMTEGLAGNFDHAQRARVTLRQFLDELGTYSHLRAAPAWIAGDKDEFADAMTQISWLEGGQLQDRLAVYLGSNTFN